VIDDGRLVYCCVPAVAWVKDADRTILIEEEKGQVWCLQGVEATVWDLLALNYTAAGIAGFLAVLWGGSVEEARKGLVSVLRDWERAGIVCAVEESWHGEPGD
jgi:hypothetical protein